MQRTMKISSVLSLLLLSTACGGDDGASTDSGATDAQGAVDAAIVDAGPPDAAPGPDAFVNDCVPTAGTDVRAQTIATGLDRPIFLTSPTGDARLFVAEQPGVIRLIIDDTLVDTAFLDIRNIVRDTGNEQGLLGMAFHPDFALNGRLFVHYTASNGDTVIAEYQVSDDDDNIADSASARIILQTDQPYTNHNGGMIDFGPDGYLYIGLGDGGSGGDPDENGEDTTTLLGSLLRIDVDGAQPYEIPADNPFAGSANGPTDPRPEIWAYGLRNPWRFSFDSDTGDLYIGDVGQNQLEEIDVQPAASTGGENYGWNTMEGTACFDPGAGCDQTGRELPIAEYSHNTGACSITGGYVYRGSCMPDLQGHYFVTDFCTNIVSTLQYPNDNTLTTLSNSLGSNIASFGQDASGELYTLTLNSGIVSRIVPASKK